MHICIWIKFRESDTCLSRRLVSYSAQTRLLDKIVVCHKVTPPNLTRVRDRSRASFHNHTGYTGITRVLYIHTAVRYYNCARVVVVVRIAWPTVSTADAFTRHGPVGTPVNFVRDASSPRHAALHTTFMFFYPFNHSRADRTTVVYKCN